MHGTERQPYLTQIQWMGEGQVTILPGWLKFPLERCQGLKMLKRARTAQEQRAASTEERFLILVVIALRSQSHAHHRISLCFETFKGTHKQQLHSAIRSLLATSQQIKAPTVATANGYECKKGMYMLVL